MKRGIVTAAFMAAMLVFFAPAAFGQIVDSTAIDTLDPMVETEPVDNTPGQSIDALNYGNLEWAVGNISAGLEEFAARTDTTAESIHVVDASDYLTPENQAAYDEAFSMSEADRGQLHAAIDDSDLLEEVFDTNGVDHETAVGIDVLDDGSVVIFYNEPEGGQ
jgi:hypothetical protein